MNLHQKLIEIRKTVSYLQKQKHRPTAQYEYVSSRQTLQSVRDKMDEMGVLLIAEITGTKVATKEEIKTDGKKTITYFTELNMIMTWVDAEKPEDLIKVQWYAQGVDIAGEKGVGKALTYAEKYFILKSFNIATDKDDPDAFQKKAEKQLTLEEQKKENKRLYEQTEKVLSILLKDYVKDLEPEDRFEFYFKHNFSVECMEQYVKKLTDDIPF